MKKLLLTTALTMLAMPALAKDYTVKEVSDPAGDKPYYFEPSDLKIEPGDTITFVNAQEDMHDVMFDVVPKAVTDPMIMSPMFEKDGEKWSYTFNTPGSYHFHCHPHEANGMTGTLVVGQASAEGDTKKVTHEEMEHHMEGMPMGEMKMAEAGQPSANAALPQGTGKINSVDSERHTVNITHEPIAALQWPTMTMEFPVAKDVSLSGFKAGDAVEFTLKPGENNQYSVISLKAHDHNHQ